MPYTVGDDVDSTWSTSTVTVYARTATPPWSDGEVELSSVVLSEVPVDGYLSESSEEDVSHEESDPKPAYIRLLRSAVMSVVTSPIALLQGLAVPLHIFGFQLATLLLRAHDRQQRGFRVIHILCGIICSVFVLGLPFMISFISTTPETRTLLIALLLVFLLFAFVVNFAFTLRGGCEGLNLRDARSVEEPRLTARINFSNAVKLGSAILLFFQVASFSFTPQAQYPEETGLNGALSVFITPPKDLHLVIFAGVSAVMGIWFRFVGSEWRCVLHLALDHDDTAKEDMSAAANFLFPYLVDPLYLTLLNYSVVAVDCTVQPDGTATLDMATHVVCWKGSHRFVATCTMVLFALYFLSSTALCAQFLEPHDEEGLDIKYFELSIMVEKGLLFILSVINVKLSSRPAWGMVAAVVISLILTAVTWTTWPCCVQSINYLKLSIFVACSWSAACSLLSLLMPASIVPVALVGGGWLLCVILLVALVWRFTPAKVLRRCGVEEGSVLVRMQWESGRDRFLVVRPPPGVGGEAQKVDVRSGQSVTMPYPKRLSQLVVDYAKGHDGQLDDLDLRHLVSCEQGMELEDDECLRIASDGLLGVRELVGVMVREPAFGLQPQPHWKEGWDRPLSHYRLRAAWTHSIPSSTPFSFLQRLERSLQSGHRLISLGSSVVHLDCSLSTAQLILRLAFTETTLPLILAIETPSEPLVNTLINHLLPCLAFPPKKGTPSPPLFTLESKVLLFWDIETPPPSSVEPYIYLHHRPWRDVKISDPSAVYVLDHYNEDQLSTVAFQNSLVLVRCAEVVHLDMYAMLCHWGVQIMDPGGSCRRRYRHFDRMETALFSQHPGAKGGGYLRSAPCVPVEVAPPDRLRTTVVMGIRIGEQFHADDTKVIVDGRYAVAGIATNLHDVDTRWAEGHQPLWGDTFDWEVRRDISPYALLLELRLVLHLKANEAVSVASVFVPLTTCMTSRGYRGLHLHHDPGELDRPPSMKVTRGVILCHWG